MVSVSEYLLEGNIKIGVEAKSKRDALKQLLSLKGLENENIIEGIMKREKLESTGFGHGLAIPHARIDNVPVMTLLVGVSRKGVEFDALDGRPVKLIFLILAPKKETKLYINILARLMKATQKIEDLTDLINSETPKEFLEKFRKFEAKNSNIIKIT